MATIPRLFQYGATDYDVLPRPIVNVVRHRQYDNLTREKIANSIRAVIGTDGAARFRDRRVLLKPTLNHGRFSEPHHRLTTHPAIITALVEVLLDWGANLSIGSVGSEPKEHLRWLYPLAERFSLELVDFQAAGYRKVQVSKSGSVSFLVSNAVLDAECVVNCANLQMHRRLRLAGGIKNMMNVVTEYQQQQTYSRLHDIEQLSEAVVDIFALVTRPAVTLLDLTSVRIDQISDHQPIFVEPGALIVSNDPVAADATACRMIGFDPMDLPTLVQARRHNLGSLESADLKITGDNCVLAPSEVVLPRAAENISSTVVNKTLGYVADSLVPRSVSVQRERCTRCGDCISVCAVDAISLDQTGVAEIDSAKCVDCGLCIEACEHDAIGRPRILIERPLRYLKSDYLVSDHQANMANGRASVSKRLSSSMWERLKTGISMNIGPINLQTTAKKRTCEKPHISKLVTPGKELSEVSGHNKQAAHSPQRPKLALIVGAGMKLGRALALRLSKEGFNIALCARNIDALAPLVEDVTANGVSVMTFQADATQSASVGKLFERVCHQMGLPDLVIYNVEGFGPGKIVEISESAFRESWEANCLGGFLVGKEAARRMVDRGRGTMIFTGATASTRGKAGYINLAVGKMGLRALAQCMARELNPEGIHVAHVILDGGMTALNPEAVAENYLHLYRQPKSAWTFELELRPNQEPW